MSLLWHWHMWWTQKKHGRGRGRTYSQRFSPCLRSRIWPAKSRGKHSFNLFSLFEKYHLHGFIFIFLIFWDISTQASCLYIKCSRENTTQPYNRENTNHRKIISYTHKKPTHTETETNGEDSRTQTGTGIFLRWQPWVLQDFPPLYQLSPTSTLSFSLSLSLSLAFPWAQCFLIFGGCKRLCCSGVCVCFGSKGERLVIFLGS